MPLFYQVFSITQVILVGDIPARYFLEKNARLWGRKEQDIYSVVDLTIKRTVMSGTIKRFYCFLDRQIREKSGDSVMNPLTQNINGAGAKNPITTPLLAIA